MEVATWVATGSGSHAAQRLSRSLERIPPVTLEAYDLEALHGTKEKLHCVGKYVSERTEDINKLSSCAIHTNDSRGSGCLVDGAWLGFAKHCILTNNHVLETAAIAETACAVFNKSEDVCETDWIQVRLDPRAGFCTRRIEDGPDYTIVAILSDDVCLLPKRRPPTSRAYQMYAAANPGAASACEPLRLDGGVVVSKGTPISVWQHPQGGFKCKSSWTISDVHNDGRIEYRNDTEPGSSGSPVFDHEGHLVGIHAFGNIDSNGGWHVPAILQDIQAVNISGFATYLELLRSGSTSAKAWAARAVTGLASMSRHNQRSIARDGAIALLVEMLKLEDVGAQLSAAEALGALALFNQDMKAAISEAGAIPPLTRFAMELHASGDTNSIQQIAYTIFVLARDNQRNQVLFEDAGAIPLLQSLTKHAEEGVRKKAGWAIDALLTPASGLGPAARFPPVVPSVPLLKKRVSFARQLHAEAPTRRHRTPPRSSTHSKGERSIQFAKPPAPVATRPRYTATFPAGPLFMGLEVGEEGWTVVRDVTEDGAAARAGVLIGSVITAVNGQPCDGLSQTEVTGLLRQQGERSVQFAKPIYRTIVSFV